jgi:hypothetical protein
MSFEVPDGWENKSVIAYQAPGRGALNTNVSLMRVDNRAPSTPLATFVMQQVSALASSLPRFELVTHKSVVLGGLPAIEVLYDWTTSDGTVRQRITVFERQGETWTFTASAMKPAFEKAEHEFAKVAGSMTFAGAAPSPIGGPPPVGGPPAPLGNPFEPPRRG